MRQKERSLRKAGSAFLFLEENMTVKIERSKKGPNYELTIDGKFAGNFDTVKEAADEVEENRKEKEGAA